MNTNEKKPVDVSKIKTSMSVVCSNAAQFGVVDHMEGASTIKLNKDGKGVHHYIPLAWVTRVDDKVHVDRPGADAMRDWSTSPPKA